MKKSTQEHKNYRGPEKAGSISKNEMFLIDFINEKNMISFSVEDLRRLSGWKSSKIHNTLYTMKKKNIVFKIKRNMFSLAEKARINMYKISTAIAHPSYISLWTALSFYGYTEQQIRTIQLISTKQHKNIESKLQRIEIVTMNPGRFYGYTMIDGFPIADKEKVIIDSFFKPDKCGGFDEVVKCFANAWNELDKRKLLEYIIKFNNKSLISRIGYIIEKFKLTGIDTDNLIKYRSNSFVKLDPNVEKTKKYDERWKIIINYS
ncbi:MAG: hypothetical protein HZB65_03300 [Candidatus Aenigmarchaeota archaeon]|nr:hypothetical protein [Candidatus Aenigmarchaeota archaeon]